MRKTIFSTLLFLLFTILVLISYLTFFGHETDKFNKIIKTEIKKKNLNISLSFEKITIKLDPKNLNLFIKFINPNLNYLKTDIPLSLLKTNINLEFLTKKKIVINDITLSTKDLDFNQSKHLFKKININNENLKLIQNGKFKIENLNLKFDENFKIKDNYIINGHLNSFNIKISEEYEIKNLISTFSYRRGSLLFADMSWNLINKKNQKNEFLNGKIDIVQKKNIQNININFEVKNLQDLLNITVMNYDLSQVDSQKVKAKLTINKKKEILLSDLSISDKNNKFDIKDIILDKNFNLINFNKISIKTNIDSKLNNDFTILNKKNILIEGRVFDAKNLLKELTKDNKKNSFINKISKSIEIDLNNILKGTSFPINKFRLVGKINKGSFEKISAKSDFGENEHLDISLKKNTNTNEKILEVYSDIAAPLLSDFKFFQGLEGGDLNFTSTFSNDISTNNLSINNFKLNEAPALAKILSLADLKGLTDTLKGEGISFDTLSAKYNTNSSLVKIDEIFMIGPSISILIDGYVEKKSGLVSLRGTLVPAKTLNNLISKIPLVGDILIGKKIGEGVFGISFKVKGLPNDLKTTVNPIKTLTPRFITRALENAKKKEAK
ncbi:MAG: hypothetical protein CBD56_02555 [Candidatus Pelagibacter sp. TMED196]|nr:MAG: hypothetical protein CBD56_02555 [Candidatus Pelagibacter sp. TMED196]|tara:strand:- start:1250 stop:3082 length:1833 start_codon:yes stop_codon:yes gene_type:complete